MSDDDFEILPSYGVRAYIGQEGDVIVRQHQPDTCDDVVLTLSPREALMLADWIQRNATDD